MKKQDLWTIYGARVNEEKQRVNISLITGEDEEKKFGTISLKLANNGKTKVAVKQDAIVVKIPILKPKKEDIKFDD